METSRVTAGSNPMMTADRVWEAAADELDRPPTANWVLVDACLLAANLLVDESSLDFSATSRQMFHSLLLLFMYTS